MKNYQQSVKQRHVKLDKLKHGYAMNQKANWPVKEQKDILERKQSANITHEFYFTANAGAESQGAVEVWHQGEPESASLPEALNLLTFCVLVLKNGFTVTGESACASPENFDADIGRKIAREQAVNKVWPLMGYELKSKLTA